MPKRLTLLALQVIDVTERVIKFMAQGSYAELQLYSLLKRLGINPREVNLANFEGHKASETATTRVSGDGTVTAPPPKY